METIEATGSRHQIEPFSNPRPKPPNAMCHEQPMCAGFRACRFSGFPTKDRMLQSLLGCPFLNLTHIHPATRTLTPNP